MKPYRLMQTRAWYGDEELTLQFPSSWEIQKIAPKDAPELTDAEIRSAFQQPIGSTGLSEMAKGKKSAAIVVDDLSRPTPASRIIPVLLQELSEIPKEEICFVIGGGSHRPLTADEISKKLGADIAAEYRVFNHDFMSGEHRPYGNLPDGLPIYINRAVADADLKICLGGIYPHGSVGFGGGSKLILPGVSGFATMFYFHTFYRGRGHAVIDQQGDQPDNRTISEAVAKVVGLEAVVNVVINSRRQVAGLFVGDFVEAQHTGAQFAAQTYGTVIPPTVRAETDLVVLNCYPLDSDPIQTSKALWASEHFENAYILAINPACDGICYHGLFDQIDYQRFLTQQNKASADSSTSTPAPALESKDQLLVWSSNFPADQFYKKHPTAILYREWEQVIEILRPKLPATAKVTVFPCASIQVLSEG